MFLSEKKQSELDAAIKELLLVAPLSEFDLLKALQNPPYRLFANNAFNNDHLLFQVHFTLYNALYRLQNSALESKQFRLSILPTKIELHPNHAIEHSKALAKGNRAEMEVEDKMRDFYLDWQNFSNTTETDVAQMLDQFWSSKAFQHPNQNLSQEMQLMGFEQLPSLESLKARYKQLSLTWHPDKGGDPSRYQELNLAYQTLRKSGLLK